MAECKAIIEANELIDTLREENEQLNKHCVEYGFIVGSLKEKNEELKQKFNDLYEELDYWKKRALLLENKYNEGDNIKWLRENTVWEQMPTSKQTVTKTHLRPKRWNE